jgi:hypothetical protein
MTAETILVEAFDRHGRALFRERIALTDGHGRFTVGRSVSADITLDDTHAAPLHVAIDVLPGGRLRASDLGSLNGIVVGGHRHRDARDLDLSDNAIQIGTTRLRVRTAHETLAPEVPDTTAFTALLHRPGWLAAAAAGAVALQAGYEGWLGAPKDLTETIITALSLLAAVTVGWVSIWALLSRVVLGEWRWLTHAAIMLATSLIYPVLDGAFDIGRFAFALPAWRNQMAWLMGLSFAVGLYFHLIYASHLSRRRAAVAAVLAPALILGGGTWFWERSASHDVNRTEASGRIYPPALRIAKASALDAYFTDIAGLRATAEAKRRAAAADDPDGSEDADD